MARNTAGQTASNAIAGNVLHQQGKLVYDATAITTTDYTQIDLGFQPRKVVWWNATDRIKLEWFDGMAQDSALKTAAAGTQTLEVTGGNHGITVSTPGSVTVGGVVAGGPASTGYFQITQNATLGAIAASKTCYWEAWA